MTVGERIKELRTALGLSQVDFADKINVSKQTLYKYENNIITNIPSDKIEAAARLGNVSPAYLMGWSKKQTVLNTFCGSGTIEHISQSEKALLDLYHSLNSTGKKEAYKRVEELTLISKYTTKEAINSINVTATIAAHARTDVDQTSEGVQHDLDIMNDDSEWD